MAQTLTTLRDDVALALGWKSFGDVPLEIQPAITDGIREAEREIYRIREWPFLFAQAILTVAAMSDAAGPLGSSPNHTIIAGGTPPSGVSDVDRERGMLGFWWVGTVNKNVPEVPFSIGAHKRLPYATGLFKSGAERGPTDMWFVSYDAPSTQDEDPSSTARWANEGAKIFMVPTLPQTGTGLAASGDTLVLHYNRMLDLTGTAFHLPSKYHFALMAGAVAKAAPFVTDPERMDVWQVYGMEWERAKQSIREEASQVGLDTPRALGADSRRWALLRARP